MRPGPRPVASAASVPFAVTAQGTDVLTPDQVRAASLVTPSRGVRFGRDLDPASAAPLAALVGCGDRAILTDLSGARAWGLPLPPHIHLREEAGQVSVALGTTATRPQRRGVRGRRLRLPDEHVTAVDGLPVTTPARTWLDCAGLLRIEYVVAMGDAILRRRLSTAVDLQHVIHWGFGRRGVRVARLALPMLDAGAESPGESWVRCHLLLGRVPRPQCNASIVHAGEWLARGDLVWDRERVVVEYDGAVHLDERQRRHDAARRNLLTAAGWLVIVFTAADLRRPWLMVATVHGALRERAPRDPA